jgi:hypothetical protein
VTDVTPLRATHEARLPDRVRREVVVVHVAAVGLERQVVDPLAFLRRAERERRQHLRLATREQAGAVCARVDADLDLDRPDLLGAAAVGATLVDRDLPADECLVDRVDRLLDELLGERVLDGLAALGRLGGADRERQADLGDDPVDEQAPLGRLELLRVLLGVGERDDVRLELLAHRRLDGDQALLLEQQVEALPVLQLLGDVVLGGLHRQRLEAIGRDLLDDRACLLQPVPLDALPDRVAELALELGGQVHVEPLRLADAAAELLERLADPADLLVGELERLEQLVLGDLVCAGLDHRQGVLRADHDQVELVGVVVGLLQRRVDDEGAVDERDADGADRAEERQARDHQRRRDAVDAEDVVRHHHVGGQHGCDALHLVAEALRPERPDRAVDHARGQGCALGGAALPLEEAARDLAGGVRLLLDVDREREEVRAFARLRPALSRREHHGVTAADDDCAVCLLCELAGLERDLPVAHGDADRCVTLGRDFRHSFASTLHFVRRAGV